MGKGMRDLYQKKQKEAGYVDYFGKVEASASQKKPTGTPSKISLQISEFK